MNRKHTKFIPTVIFYIRIDSPTVTASSKTRNGVTTTYYLDGNRIVGEETQGNVTLYIYDASGAPIGMQYHGADYAEDAWDVFWYEKNLQGDIVAIYDESGTLLIKYNYYTAWGEFSKTYYNNGINTAAYNNPFTYRGYYYESSLNMYYLGTRYYDPYNCRFISADGYISTGQGILGNNMYAYCNNNPVMYVDPTGEFLTIPFTIVIAKIGAAYVAVAAIELAAVALIGNVASVISSNIIVEKLDNTESMEQDAFNELTDEENKDKSTNDMNAKERMAFINAIKEYGLGDENPYRENWTKAEMYREMKYHDAWHEIFVFFGSDPNKEGTYAYRTKYVDFESEKTFKTYLFRFVGNIIPW